MKDDMYTYHYFKSRSIVGASKSANYAVKTAVLCGIAFAVTTLVKMFH